MDPACSGVSSFGGKGVPTTSLSESTLLGLEEHLYLLTSQTVDERIAYYEKQLRLWRALRQAVADEPEELPVSLVTPRSAHAVSVDPSRLPIWRQVYDCLQACGSSTPAEIARATGLKRTQVYNALGRLGFRKQLDGRWSLVEEEDSPPENTQEHLTHVNGSHNGQRTLCD